MRRTRFTTVAVVAILGMIAVSCGSDDKDSSSSAATVGATTAPTPTDAASPDTTGASTGATTGDTADAGTTPAPVDTSTPTGSEILIGTIGSFTGPLASAVDFARPEMQAWVSDVNAHGGLNGHPVKLIIKDDGGNAAQSLTALQELIDAGVVALVGESSTGDVNWVKPLEESGLPVVGGNGVQIAYDISPDFFASGTNIFAAVYGDMVLAKRYGPDLAIIPCTESPVCAASVNIYQQYTESLGMKIVYSQTVAASTPDFTAVCQALKDSGAQSYVVVDAVSVIIRLSNTCVQQGVTAKLIESSGAVGPELLDQAGAEGLLAADVNFPFIDDTTPATKHFHEVIEQYLDPEMLNYPALNTVWAALELFKASVNIIGDGEVTPDAIKEALYSMKDETLGGLAPPLNFKKGQVNFQNCYFVLGIAGGKYTAPDGVTPSCAPDDLVNGVGAAFLAAQGG